jgi:hypothetical protein
VDRDDVAVGLLDDDVAAGEGGVDLDLLEGEREQQGDHRSI